MKIGIAGIGFMGMIHYLSYQKVDDVQVQALCEVNEKRLAGDWRDIQGNFGPAGTMMDLSGIDTYTELDAMLADDSLDMIDICLPPSMHTNAVVNALRAGKHVFCEKPMALTIDETELMVATAQEANKMLMIGHVLPLFPEFAYAREIINSGKYGKLLGGHFKRIISDPLWLPDYYNPKRIGAAMLDLHIHDAHYIRLLFGMPQAVRTQGRMRGEVVEYFNTQFEYEDRSLVVSAASGVLRQQGRPFCHGFEIQLEKATLLFEFAVVDGNPELMMPLSLLTEDGKVFRPELGSGDPVNAFEAEIREVVNAIQTNIPSPILAGNLAQDAVILCNKQTESARTGERVEI